MPANTNPLFGLTPNIGRAGGATGIGTTAVTDYDGTGAGNVLAFTAGANGSFLSHIMLKAKGTNAVSVARCYENNGSANSSAGNNSFFREVGLPVTTASTTLETPNIVIPCGFVVPATHTIYIGISAVSNLATGWASTAYGMDY
jgi:hypothetical protein